MIVSKLPKAWLAYAGSSPYRLRPFAIAPAAIPLHYSARTDAPTPILGISERLNPMPDYDVYVYEFKDEDLGANTYRVRLTFNTPHFRLLLIDRKADGWELQAQHLYVNGRVVEDEVIARQYKTKAAALDDIESILIAAGVRVPLIPKPPKMPNELNPDPTAWDSHSLWLDSAE